MTDTEPAGNVGGRIVVGIDGSPPSLDALRWAGHQAALTGATLEVVITWQWPNTYGWGLPLPSDYQPDGDMRKVLDQAIESALGGGPDLHIVRRVVQGHPAQCLVQISKGADLLVVGNRGHGEFVGMLVGSVSEHCVSTAHCPVLVYRDGDGDE